MLKLLRFTSLFLIFFIVIESCEKNDDSDVPVELVNKKFRLSIKSYFGWVDVVINGNSLPYSESYTIDSGTTVQLIANPLDFFKFSKWSGDFNSTNFEDTLLINSDKEISANYLFYNSWIKRAVESKTITISGYNNPLIFRFCPGGYFPSNENDGDSSYDDSVSIVRKPFWICDSEITNELVVIALNRAHGLNADGTEIDSIQSIFSLVDSTAPNYLSSNSVKLNNKNLGKIGTEKTGYEYPIYFDGAKFQVKEGLENTAAGNITWYGAIFICNQLTNLALNINNDEKFYKWDINFNVKVNTNSNGFRLPESEEWECAARWQGHNFLYNAIEMPPTSGIYWTPGKYASGAQSLSRDEMNAVAYYSLNATTPIEIKSLRPNYLLLYDMTGNVAEWCFDKFYSDLRIVRGSGCINYSSSTLYVGNKSGHMPNSSRIDLGFRLAISAE